MELGRAMENHPAARGVLGELLPKPREVMQNLLRLSQNLSHIRIVESTPGQKYLRILTEVANPFTERVSQKQGQLPGQMASAVAEDCLI